MRINWWILIRPNKASVVTQVILFEEITVPIMGLLSICCLDSYQWGQYYRFEHIYCIGLLNLFACVLYVFGRDIQVVIRSLFSSASLTWIINQNIISWMKISAEKAGSSFLGSSFLTPLYGFVKNEDVKNEDGRPCKDLRSSFLRSSFITHPTRDSLLLYQSV